MTAWGRGCVKTHFARRVGWRTGEFNVISRLKLRLLTKSTKQCLRCCTSVPGAVPEERSSLYFLASESGYERSSITIQTRPGCRVVTSWTSHVLPSGSLKEKYDP